MVHFELWFTKFNLYSSRFNAREMLCFWLAYFLK